MSKAPSPLLGFNNNIKHKGRVFHVQTEDSGVRHPHIITHLFMDGGRIVKTMKTSYAEHLGAENMGEVVRKMMKDQHKAMFVALRDGHFDDIIAKSSSGTGQAVKVPDAPPSSKADIPPVSQAPVSRAEPPAAPPVAPPPAPDPPAPPPAAAAAPAPPAAPVAPAGPTFTPIPPGSSSSRSGRFPTAEALADELNTFERAAADARRPSMTPAAMSDLPPPPANVLQKARPEGGGYREVSPDAETRRSRSQQPGAAPSEPPPPPAHSPSSPPGGDKPAAGRYSVSRPSPAFASGKPPEGRSIFGEDLISEKSLDEVILSYLAEDLDTPPPKK